MLIITQQLLALSVANITPVSIASGKSLSGAITVTAGSLKLNETGTLASTYFDERW